MSNNNNHNNLPKDVYPLHVVRQDGDGEHISLLSDYNELDKVIKVSFEEDNPFTHKQLSTPEHESKEGSNI